MKALVTGANGFLGSAIARRLLAEGAEVRVLVRRGADELRQRGAEVVLGDIRDAGAVTKACSGRDAVFHSAARVGIWGPRREFFETNVGGTKNVISACAAGTVRALIYTSSPSVVFGRKSLAGADETVPYPESFLAHYPASKAAAEKELLRAHDGGGLRTLALRPHLIWGPGDTHIIPGILERGSRGTFQLVGDGAALADFTYIDNVVAAHLQAAEALLRSNDAGGRAYFIGQDEPITIRQFVEKVLACIGVVPKFRSIPPPLAYLLGLGFETVYSVFRLSGEPRLTRFLASQLSTSHYFNISSAKSLLGYRPEVSMEAGFSALQKSIAITGDKP